MASSRQYQSVDTLPRLIPIFPLPGALLLPRTQLPLNIFEPRYLQMMDDVLKSHRIIGMMQPIGEKVESQQKSKSGPTDIYGIGCAGRITSFTESEERTMLVLTGLCRFRVVAELAAETPYRQVEADYTDFAGDLQSGLGQDDVDRGTLLKTFRAYLEAHNLVTDWDEVMVASNEMLVNSLSALSPFAAAEKQALLEAPNLRARAELLIALTEMTLSIPQRGDGHQLQ